MSASTHSGTVPLVTGPLETGQPETGPPETGSPRTAPRTSSPAAVPTRDASTAGGGYRGGILSHDISTELGRLRLLESELDPATRALLTRVGAADGQRFLEVGAGAGSVAYWLADSFPAGHVTAVDVNTGFLEVGGRPNLEIRQADVLVDEFPAASFDLIHARTVLLHLPRRDEAIRRLVSWLRPGGVLVTEDLVIYPADTSPHAGFRHAFEAMDQAMARSIGTDQRWGRSLPGPLGAAGLVDLGLTATFYPVTGSNGIGRLWHATFSQSADFLVESGLLSQADFDATLALLADPGFADLGPSIIAAWGRRPKNRSDLT